MNRTGMISSALVLGIGLITVSRLVSLGTARPTSPQLPRVSLVDSQAPVPLRDLAEEIADTPKYDLKSEKCSEYAVNAANWEFGKNFRRGNAWDLLARNRLVASINNPGVDIPNYISAGVLRPGMIIGTFYEDSFYKDDPRVHRGSGTTHAMTYAGVDIGNPDVVGDEHPAFYHQYGSIQETILLPQLAGRKLHPKFIIDER